MGYTNWVNSKIKKLNWIDIKLIKWSVAGFVLLVAKLWPPVLSLDWYWYALVGVLAAIRPTYKVFSK
jgi:hypothetical protein